jgi:hypothetical protein
MYVWMCLSLCVYMGAGLYFLLMSHLFQCCCGAMPQVTFAELLWVDKLGIWLLAEAKGQVRCSFILLGLFALNY